MRYKGTEIDGLSSTLDRMEVHGRDVVQLVGTACFAAATLHLFTGRWPQEEEIALADRFLSACADACPPAPRPQRARGRAALAMGLLELSPELAHAPEAGVYGVSGELVHALAAAAVTPVLAARLAGGHELVPPTQVGSYSSRIFNALAGRPPEVPAEVDAIDALLVAWHAGFGPLTPTVYVPRAVAGTGSSALEALAAGMLAAGPLHIGASAHAMRFLHAIAQAVRGGADLEAATRAQIAVTMKAHGIVHGMGHPLLVRDPRPAGLRAVARALGDRLPLQVYDHVVALFETERSLYPNVDMATAAVLLALGIEDPDVAVGVALGARGVSMVAHIAERRGKPPFGVDSRTARSRYATLDIDWL